MKEGQRYTLGKEERVTGEKRIEKLFTDGQSFIAYPLRVVFIVYECEKRYPISILISIPKKRLRLAVERNRMKRLIREAYRLNKHLFDGECLQEGQALDMAFIYVKNEMAEYAAIEKGVKKALREVSLQLNREEKECSNS